MRNNLGKKCKISHDNKCKNVWENKMQKFCWKNNREREFLMQLIVPATKIFFYAKL